MADQAAQRIALTADDDEFFRMALNAILTRNFGFAEVIEAGSFDDAVEQLSERSPVHLALLDLQMPGMEISASVRAVRESFPETQVVVVSSSKQKADIIRALAAGAHGYIPKAMGIDELTQALRIVLQGKSIYAPPFLADLGAENQEFESGPGAGSSPIEKEGQVLLTPRQRQALEFLVQGMSNKQIARVLNLGEGTIKVHMAALFRILGVSNRAEAAAVGARMFTDSRNDERTRG